MFNQHNENLSSNVTQCKGCNIYWNHLAASEKCIFCKNSTSNLRKEIIVKKSFEAFGQHFDLHDSRLSVSKLRPDLLNYKDRKCAICVCVDEKQHSNETEFDRHTRMFTIGRALNKPTLFIRFNPDNFCVNNEKQQVPYEERFFTLYHIYSILQNQIFIDNKKDNEFYCVYLFYNGFNSNSITLHKIEYENISKIEKIVLPKPSELNYKHIISVFKQYLLSMKKKPLNSKEKITKTNFRCMRCKHFFRDNCDLGRHINRKFKCKETTFDEYEKKFLID